MPRLPGGRHSRTKMARYMRRRYWYAKFRAQGVPEDRLEAEYLRQLRHRRRIAWYAANKESACEKTRRWQAENRERFQAYARKYREEHREEILTTRRAYYWKKRKHLLAKARAWKQRNLERCRESQRRWYRKNAERLREKARVRYYSVVRPEMAKALRRTRTSVM